MIALEHHVVDARGDGIAVFHRRRQHDALGADRQHRLVADFERLDHEGLDQAFAHLDLAGFAFHGTHGAPQQIVVADEARDEFPRWLLVERLRRRHLLDFAVIEDRDAVRQRHRFLLVVGDIDHGDAEFALDRADLELQLLPQAPV